MKQGPIIKYKETEKFNQWARSYLDSKNKTTYGNATQSALKIYNTTNYKSASVIGRENLVKLRHLSSIIVEQIGFGYFDLIKIGLDKMLKGSYDDWERMMRFLGYFD